MSKDKPNQDRQKVLESVAEQNRSAKEIPVELIKQVFGS